MIVDLVYSPDCPNVEPTRKNLLRAFEQAGITPCWLEHRIGDPNAPERTRGYGSPTVLVEGRDVAGEPPRSDVSCRLYSGALHAPSVEQIALALQGSKTAPEKSEAGSGCSA